MSEDADYIPDLYIQGQRENCHEGLCDARLRWKARLTKLMDAAQYMLDLEARRMYEHDLLGDLPGPIPCPCPGCKALREAIAGLKEEL